MNIEHLGRWQGRLILPRMDAVHGTDIHARRVLGADAGLTNNIRHSTYNYNRSTDMKLVLRRAALLATIALGGAVCARAQGLPSEPVALAGGRLTTSGDVSASIGPAATGLFNYPDDEPSAL